MFMKNITQSDLANFASLVTKAWADPKLAQAYAADPQKVLAQYGISVPAGVPTPVIPEQPQGDIGQAWQNTSFDNWELTVTPLDPNNPGTDAKVSCFACIACPWSCFSSWAPS